MNFKMTENLDASYKLQATSNFKNFKKNQCLQGEPLF